MDSTNVFASLEGRNLPQGFNWINEPKEWAFCPEGLTVQAEPQTDFFRDPNGTVVKDSAHYLYTEQEGDFTFVTKVQSEMIDDYDAACMMVMLDDETWGKLCYEYTYKRPMIVSVVTKRLSDDCNSLEVPAQGVYLRITRFDDCFAFHYSLDGKWWEMVRYFTLPASSSVKIGIVAQSPTGNGCKVQFSNLNVSPEGIRDIRSGV
ncbi:MAG: DUF1349 domain-containing protein [Bacillota bacterium]|nr:DUF1349 domain-containing protein [Bacillota bacterium]HHU60782.1 DUF1349 domain-containing protein [Natronincola sp.]